MKTTNWDEFRERVLSPERRARNDARALEIVKQYESLKDLRRAFHKTQAEVARVLDADQSEVSRIERRTDLFVSTLREYVRALGGELEIHAVLPTGRVRLCAFDLDREDALELVADDDLRRQLAEEAATDAVLPDAETG